MKYSLENFSQAALYAERLVSAPPHPQPQEEKEKKIQKKKKKKNVSNRKKGRSKVPVFCHAGAALFLYQHTVWYIITKQLDEDFFQHRGQLLVKNQRVHIKKFLKCNK